jgi:hypothetical protein
MKFMPKDYFQGINTPNQGGSSAKGGKGRSIRNIPISHSHSQKHERARFTDPLPATLRAASGGNTSYIHRSVWKRFLVWAIAAVAVVALLLVVVSMFKSTSVVITPRTHQLVLTEDIPLTAYPAGSENAAVGALAYDVFETVHDAETTVKASGFTEVEEYATGLITVYNEYTKNSVRLIKNTRFETPTGLVFRVRDSIVVPGKRDTGPGTITVTVYADAPGERYNTGPISMFTLPGLKGGDMFSSVYARSTNAFQGGFIGSKPKIADTDLKIAQATLRGEIEEKARVSVLAASVPGQIVFPQLMMLTFESLPSKEGADGSAVVRERAIARVPTFPSDLFAKVLAVSVRADVNDAIVHLDSIDGITIRSISSAGVPEYGISPVDFLVSGNAVVIWDVDTDALGEALGGRAKASFQNVISTFPSIEKADAFIRPFWRSTFPNEIGDITFVVNESTQ